MSHHRFHLRTAALEAAAELSAPWTVLFGPSGAGKTTLLRGLCGLLPAGDLLLFERAGVGDLTALPPHRRGLSWSPQHAALLQHLTVRENIAFAAGTRSKRADTFAEQAIALLDVGPLLDRRPLALSGGESRRVALARALAAPDARLLLLDEPFAALDRAARDRLLPGLRQWCAERSLPVLSVTHDVEEALLLDAEVLRVGAGTLLAQGPARTVLAEERERLLQSLATCETGS